MRDEIAQEFLGINIETSTAVAVRNFEAQIFMAKKDEKGLLFTNIDDFSLYKIGEFDSETGYVNSCTPELLRKACECDV